SMGEVLVVRSDPDVERAQAVEPAQRRWLRGARDHGRLVARIVRRERKGSMLARLIVRLLALQRERQVVAVQAQTGVVQAALEQARVALQGVQRVRPVRGDHGAHLVVAMELEADLDPPERGRLELYEQALDAGRHRLSDLDTDQQARRRLRSSGLSR